MKKEEYTAPEMEISEVIAERGFAESFRGGVDAVDFEYGGEF